MNLRLWEKIVQNGDFHTSPAPFGIKMFFFGQEFMINNIKEMKPRLALFSDRYPHSCRARMQLSMNDPHFSLIYQIYVDYDGFPIIGEDVDITLQYGDPKNPNPNYDT